MKLRTKDLHLYIQLLLETIGSVLEVYGLEETLADLKRAGFNYLTIGQYLVPSKQHLSIVRYVPPHEFESLAPTARSMGFQGVVAGPLVRSSYKAEKMFQTEKELNYRRIGG